MIFRSLLDPPPIAEHLRLVTDGFGNLSVHGICSESLSLDVLNGLIRRCSRSESAAIRIVRFSLNPRHADSNHCDPRIIIRLPRPTSSGASGDCHFSSHFRVGGYLHPALLQPQGRNEPTKIRSCTLFISCLLTLVKTFISCYRPPDPGRVPEGFQKGSLKGSQKGSLKGFCRGFEGF